MYELVFIYCAEDHLREKELERQKLRNEELEFEKRKRSRVRVVVFESVLELFSFQGSREKDNRDWKGGVGKAGERGAEEKFWSWRATSRSPSSGGQAGGADQGAQDAAGGQEAGSQLRGAGGGVRTARAEREDERAEKESEPKDRRVWRVGPALLLLHLVLNGEQQQPSASSNLPHLTSIGKLTLFTGGNLEFSFFSFEFWWDMQQHQVRPSKTTSPFQTFRTKSILRAFGLIPFKFSHYLIFCL